MFADIADECIAEITRKLWGALANAMRDDSAPRVETLTRALETLGAA